MRPSTSTGKPAASAVGEKAKVWLSRVLSALLAVLWLLFLAADRLDLALPGRPGWLEALLLLLAAAATLAALARQLPVQNVLLAAAVIAIMGGAAHALGVKLGIPFGPFLFGVDAGPQLFKTLPWSVPLIWVVVILNSRGVARLILRPWRKVRTYGFWLIGVTAVLALLFDLAFDPFATRVEHYWLWLQTRFPSTWQGTPAVNFVSWTAVSLLILAFVTPALINKNPIRRSPDFQPLAVWLGAMLWFALACAQHAMWPAVALDSASIVLTAVFAVRGGRW